MAIKRKFSAYYGIDNNANPIVNVADPTNAQDVVTKAYGTNASNLAAGTIPAARLPAFSGDASTSAGASVFTLATVTQSTGSSFVKITLDGKGRVTGNTAVAQADITGLLGANSLAETMIADGSVLARLAANETISGTWTFSNTPTISSIAPGIFLHETDAAADAKRWMVVADGSNFAIQTRTDADVYVASPLTMTRSGALTLTSTISATKFTSTIATGTAPFTVASTTMVTNLNADLLDGQHGSYYAPIASPTFTGIVGVLSSSAAVEMGRIDGIAGSTFIDFHTGATPVDYDSRILATGGNGTSGNGTLYFTAGGYTFQTGSITGNGSGLTNVNADTVDSKHVGTSGSTIPVLDAANTWSAMQTFYGGFNTTLGSNYTVGSYSLATVTPANIDTFAVATYRSASYQVQISSGANYTITQITVIHDGTNVSINEFGTSVIGSALGTFDASITTGNLNLIFTAASATSTTVRLIRTAIIV